MKNKIKGFGLLAALIVTVLSAPTVYATASQFMASTYGVGSSTGTSATTTYSWITPGAGTTTVIMLASTAVTTKYDNAFIGFEVTATSAPQNSKLNARIEYSWDGIDYYQDTSASTTGPVMGVMQNELSFNIATSTSFSDSGLATRLHAGFFVQTPTPYTRVVFYSPIGGANLSLHVRAQPIKQVQIINQ